MRRVFLIPFLLLGACSLIRDPAGIEGTACVIVSDAEGEPRDPCGPGFACVPENGAGVCRAAESCDGIDNDGDGATDEGFDRDNDGYRACVIDGPDFDCDDTTADRNPGQTERCDGIDHDCDGRAYPESDAERHALCLDPAYPDCNQEGDCLCDQRQEDCVDFDCRAGDVYCERNFLCENYIPDDCTAPPCEPIWGCRPAPCTAAMCAEAGAFYCSSVDNSGCLPIRALGEPCNEDAGCITGSCAPKELFALEEGQVINPEEDGAFTGYCVEPCCNDYSCEDKEFCWTRSTGLSTCWPDSVATEVTGRSGGLGPGGPLAGCGSNADCRSGLCDGDCVAACRTDADCPGHVCGVGGDASLGSVCVDRGFLETEGGGDCTLFGDCGFDCREIGGFFESECLEGCNVNSDCGGSRSCQVQPVGGRFVTVCTDTNVVETCCNDDQCGNAQCLVQQSQGRAIMLCGS